MSELIKFEGTEVRVDVDENGDPLFCASDVARCLGYTLPVKAIGDHCRGVLKRNLIDSLGRTQEANFIREPDVYRLAFRSQLASAQKFVDWVVEEVIPSIRKTGKYSIEKPPTYSEALRKWADALDEKEKALREKDFAEQAQKTLLLQAKKDEPFVNAGKALLTTTSSCLIGLFAKAIEINGKVIKPNKLFEFLRKNDVLFKRDGHNFPYQKHIEAGRFVVVQHPPIITDTGMEKIVFTTRITPKGEGFVINLLLNDADLCGVAITVRGKNIREF
jgi:anti-repressor protein